MANRAKTEKTRNNGTMTEAQYFAKIRSALRNAFRYWKPGQVCLENASRLYKGPNKRQKKEFQCAKCKKWFKRTDVQIDHIIECGSLRSFEDIPGFITRLTTENISDYQILCKKHHLEKTKQAKDGKREQEE